jgi:hypothetical protein
MFELPSLTQCGVQLPSTLESNGASQRAGNPVLLSPIRGTLSRRNGGCSVLRPGKKVVRPKRGGERWWDGGGVRGTGSRYGGGDYDWTVRALYRSKRTDGNEGDAPRCRLFGGDIGGAESGHGELGLF